MLAPPNPLRGLAHDAQYIASYVNQIDGLAETDVSGDITADPDGGRLRLATVSGDVTVRAGEPMYSLEAEFAYAPLFAARKLGLDEEWIDRLEEHDPHGRRALSVTRAGGGFGVDR